MVRKRGRAEAEVVMTVTNLMNRKVSILSILLAFFVNNWRNKMKITKSGKKTGARLGRGGDDSDESDE